MVIVILLVVSGDITGLCRAYPGSTCQIGIGLCYPLAESIVSVGVVRSAAGQSTAGQPGQLALAPGCGHAIVSGGTAHGVVGDAAAATYILPSSPPAVKKKPPRLNWPGRHGC